MGQVPCPRVPTMLYNRAGQWDRFSVPPGKLVTRERAGPSSQALGESFKLDILKRKVGQAPCPRVPHEEEDGLCHK